ncbi:MAG: FAD-dependent oxidoreductase [Candidatus Omnitrophica bacterium]|nr:FAD-dependent oxidoreductase [Candidatus Omnitrophota bacterium]
MTEFYGKLIERIKRTGCVESFRFGLKEKLDFAAGQFIQVIFDEKDRKNGALNKYLTISSSPGKDYMEFTKKLSDSKFSEKLDSLKVGTEVLFKGPMGKCVYDASLPKIGFLVGGIGVTPAISMIEHIVGQKLSTDVMLLYSNWTAADIAFKSELDAWKAENPHIQVVYTVVMDNPKDENISVGMITKDLVLQKVLDYQDRVWYIFGPPTMVTAMKGVCQSLGISEDKLHAETFLGY